MHQYRKQYLEYLSEIVVYPEGQRPRVRHPMKWGKIQSSSITSEFVNLETTSRKIWIWSDHHFKHERVISMTDRPFANTDEMKTHFVSAYNEVVAPGDILIWGGDVTFGSTTVFNEEVLPLFDKTYNILVQGNHDFKGKNPRKLNFDEHHLLLSLKLKNKKVVVVHYPFECKDKDVVVVHGHTHNRDTGWSTHRNVSVEAIGYKPVSLIDML